MKKDANLLASLCGIAMVVGFFLPFIDLGVATLSGWEIVRSSQAAWTTRLALALLPLGGGALALAGLSRSDSARKLSWAMGAGVLGFLTFKMAWGFFKLTGIGLWLVIAAAVVAVGLGLARKSAAAE